MAIATLSGVQEEYMIPHPPHPPHPPHLPKPYTLFCFSAVSF
jgi:hypothetical protein